MTSLAERIASVQQQVTEAAAAAGRSPGDVTIVAVSKTAPREAVDLAAELGLRHFGENRVLDALRKFETPLPPGCALHLIGQLQTNKARPAVGLFDVIESVDRMSLVTALEKEAARVEKRLPVLVQVNIAGEAQKAGCAPEEAHALLAALTASAWLEPQGLMTMAPLVADPEDVRFVFRGLRELRDRLQEQFADIPLPILSMGMSNDYPVAIAEGATLVRVGRAIFGG
ncbi:MAG: YggS family pyridoxal phosphate-dependent enzyme [Thermomicrobiales bacterium]|nr:YggS family pyridoxal phosphate-dependent enzyme [Thermomicrobiales bacterium]